jgi:hypothetical protein
VSHACNPSYSGDIDQKDPGSKPTQANSSARPYLEKPFTKIGLVEWLKVKALSSNPSTHPFPKKGNRVVVVQKFRCYKRVLLLSIIHSHTHPFPPPHSHIRKAIYGSFKS